MPPMRTRVGRILTCVLATALGWGCEGSGGGAATTTEPEAAPPQARGAVDAGRRQEKAEARPRRLPPIKGAMPAPPDVAAPPEGAERTESGIASVVLVKGRGGKRPGPYDVVTVNYSGWTTDGRNFDNSYRNGKASEFRLTDVIAGWTEGLQLMTKGEKRRLWIPAKLAYEGRPDRPQGMLVFDVELLDVDPAPPLPPVPPDVAAPPEDAERSESGLAWKVLRKGRGKATPTDASKVTLAYTVWDTDGKLYRSTVLDGRPAEMDVGRISAEGLREGLKLMVKGERRRFWVPAELAYKGRPSGPQGMVVMDVEVLQIAD